MDDEAQSSVMSHLIMWTRPLSSTASLKDLCGTKTNVPVSPVETTFAVDEAMLILEGFGWWSAR